MKWKLGATALVLACLLGLLFVSGCAKKATHPFISLEGSPGGNPGTGLEPGNDEPLRVAIASIASTRESIVYYEALLGHLEEYVGRPVHIVQRKTYAEVNDLLRAGTVDLGFICTYSYVLARDEFGLDILVAPVINEKMEYYSYIIVHKDSGIKSFEELRGKSFAFTDPISNSGRLYPLYKLYKKGERPETFFSQSIFTYSHDNSVNAVAEKLVDGAAVDSLIFYYMEDRYPDVFSNVTVIDKSQPFGIQPVVVRPGVDAELRNTLKTFFLTLHETGRGQKILRDLKFDRFMPQDDSAYDGIREMADILMR
jgi:phosphonate transport system substrate-binding protein